MSGPRIFTPEYYARMRDLEASGWWNAGMRTAGTLLLRQADLPARGALLDLGCGSGQTMAWLREILPEWTSLGLDVAEDGLRAARHFGESVLAASALDVPVASETFDAVITLDVLQHLPLPDGDARALEEIQRVLKPGGVLFLRTNAQAFPSTTDDPEHDFRKYRTGDLSAKLTGAGFDVLRLSRLNALLGLAEIPRELKARRRAGDRYHGILASGPGRSGWSAWLKQSWLEMEARLVASGIPLPFGRTIVALCRKRP